MCVCVMSFPTNIEKYLVRVCICSIREQYSPHCIHRVLAVDAHSTRALRLRRVGVDYSGGTDCNLDRVGVGIAGLEFKVKVKKLAL